MNTPAEVLVSVRLRLLRNATNDLLNRIELPQRRIEIAELIGSDAVLSRDVPAAAHEIAQCFAVCERYLNDFCLAARSMESDSV